MNNRGPGTVDAERVQDLQEVGRKLDLDSAEITSLLEQHGLGPVETALAEASRAGDRLFAPAAFVKRRAAKLAEAETREAEFNSRRSASIDRESRERIAESASARVAADNDMNAVNKEIARIPVAALERLKATALAEMGAIPRAVAQRRGFADSPAWRIAVAKLRREELTKAGLVPSSGIPPVPSTGTPGEG